MIPGIVASQRRVATSAPVLWTPLNMATVPQIYLHAQDSVVTDVSGFASAISNLGAMGSNGNFSQATADNRPAILAAELNGKRVLSFDGTNDFLQADSVAARSLLTSVGAAWVFSVHKKRALDASPTTRYLFAENSSTGGRFIGAIGSSTSGNGNKPRIFARRLDADGQSILAAPDVVQGSYAMTLYRVYYSSREGAMGVDGTVVASNATLMPTAGNTSTSVATNAFTIGVLLPSSGFGDIDLAAIVIGNTTPSSDDIDRLEGWAAHEFGLTANLPGDHPYKTVAPTV